MFAVGPKLLGFSLLKRSFNSDITRNILGVFISFSVFFVFVYPGGGGGAALNNSLPGAPTAAV
jgi:hypothetical protein